MSFLYHGQAKSITEKAFDNQRSAFGLIQTGGGEKMEDRRKGKAASHASAAGGLVIA